MADTRVQHTVEEWFCEKWMPQEFGHTFKRLKVTLTTGGEYNFDAVSENNEIVATISTSGSRTSGGKHAAGKLFKIRSDILFLMLVKASRRIVVLTEEDMYELCMKELLDGRVPHEIEFLHAKLPEELAKNLDAARKKASAEVSPRSV